MDIGIYNYISRITPHYKFQYLVYGILIIILVRRISPDPYTVLAIIVAMFFIYYWHDGVITEGDSHIHELERKLATPLLQKTKHLYIDTELIDFLSEYERFKTYNSNVYRRIVRHTDDFMLLVRDMEKSVPNPGENYETARELKKGILNLFHSLIHSLPTDESQNFRIALKRLESLLNEHISAIYVRMISQYAKNPKPINTLTKFIYNNDPTGIDTQFNAHYDYLS